MATPDQEAQLQQQIDQQRKDLLDRTSPGAFAVRLRDMLAKNPGQKQLEQERIGIDKNLGTARTSLTANLTPEELQNLNPAQQRNLVQGQRSGLEASRSANITESNRIGGDIGTAVEGARALEQDIQSNLINRLDFLQKDLQNVQAKKSEARQIAFGIANSGVTLTPELSKQLDATLSKSEKELWLAQNSAAIKKRNEDLALQRAALGGGEKGLQSVTDPNTGELLTFNPNDGTYKNADGTPVKGPAAAPTFDQFLADAEKNAGQSFSPSRRQQLQNAFNETQRTAQAATKLPARFIAPVGAIAGQFDGEPVIKNYNEVQNKYQSVNKIIKSGVGGPGDLALVFEFMKGLDPTSVVRESEYATAAKSGNIFRGAFAKFNGYFKEKGGFLPKEVQESFQSILGSKMNVAENQYQNVFNEYGRRINKITGRTDGTDYLTDYSKAFMSQNGQSTSGKTSSGLGYTVISSQ